MATAVVRVHKESTNKSPTGRILRLQSAMSQGITFVNLWRAGSYTFLIIRQIGITRHPSENAQTCYP
ncbi:hypothetical protein CY34DRAFT_347524 [Suillus luteus UH-Slu-Lm8-n1]|uniref:Uncharacterized protein n=1 Tax=Suillus luteus UH-Slu-Lm8-n1 TaxID=930992 RepID=A0A0D0AXY8_9AGAM|nr:hypothetical protein CY34DRAFT_347524 [Suillus luteus UH-Slu-Lm8-n1]